MAWQDTSNKDMCQVGENPGTPGKKNMLKRKEMGAEPPRTHLAKEEKKGDH